MTDNRIVPWSDGHDLADIFGDLDQRLETLRIRRKAQEEILANLQNNNWESAYQIAKESHVHLFDDPVVSPQIIKNWEQASGEYAKFRKSIEELEGTSRKGLSHLEKDVRKFQAISAVLMVCASLQRLDLETLRKHTENVQELAASKDLPVYFFDINNRIERDAEQLLKYEQSHKRELSELKQQLADIIRDGQPVPAEIKSQIAKIIKNPDESYLYFLWEQYDFNVRVHDPGNSLEGNSQLTIENILGKIRLERALKLGDEWVFSNPSSNSSEAAIREQNLWKILVELEECLQWLPEKLFAAKVKGKTYGILWLQKVESIIIQLMGHEIKRVKGKKYEERKQDWDKYLESRKKKITRIAPA